MDGDTININRAYQVAWIVYINGLEVPVHSVNVRYGVWNIPEAEVTLIPDPIMQRFGAEDRVTVQVFYCDYWQNPNQPEFRLMFDGEVVGWSYVNVKSGRAVSLSCIDYAQIFTQLFFFFMSNVDDIAIGASNESIGVGINQVTTPGFGAVYPYSLFADGLISAEGSAPLITRPIDFVYNVVRALIQHDAPNRSVPAANFFAPWARRTNFHRRFISLPFLEEPGLDEAGNPRAGVFPILRAVRADFAVSAVARIASNIGSAGSIWDMLQQVMQTLMMEIQMLPTPSAVVTNYDKLSTLGPPTHSSQYTKPIVLTNYFVKPQFLFGLPPTCNVFFPSQIRHFAYDENYITQPTRMYFNEETILSYLNTDNTTSSGLGTMIRDALAVAHPEEVHQAARAALSGHHENSKNLLVYPEEFFKGPVVDRRSLPRWFTFLLQAQQENPNPAPTETETDAREVSTTSTELNVYRKYAQYEYFKERYARRTAAVELAFNPYPVPGFPCVIFDDRDTQMDVIGYVMNVDQSLHSSGWSTRVSVSYGRTLKEMFRQLQDQIDADNQSIQVNHGRTEQAITEGTQQTLDDDTAIPVGAIATAPPEPILEIRDVIQNFQRAEAFYRSLFFRIPSPADREISQQQLRAEADRRAAHQEGQTPAQPRIDPPPVGATTDSEQLTNELNGRRASFWYHEILDFVTPEGARESIQLEGFDASSRLQLLEVITKMRRGAASDAELEFARQSVNRPNLAQVVAGQPANPALTDELNSIELAVRTATVKANLGRGEYLVPKEEAKHLFESYDAAMKYNARPICTLDEYLKFLGEDAEADGRVEPKIALSTNDSRSFPAHFYLRIRRYTPGPPEAGTPVGVISNTEGRSTPDGSAIVGEARPVTGAEGLPENFPQTSTDWDYILLIYRSNALNKLPPRS